MKREELVFENQKVYVYSFELMDSRMYMLREKDEMLIVDPCEEAALLEDAKGVKRALVLLTHEHFDHISGVNWLREHFECEVFASRICARNVQSVKENLSSRFAFLFLLDKEKYDYVRRNIKLPYTCYVDKDFEEYEEFWWSSHNIKLYEVAGHSPGSSMIFLDDKMLFSGDNLLSNGKELAGTDACAEAYEKYVRSFIEKLREDIFVLPGHGEAGVLKAFLCGRK